VRAASPAAAAPASWVVGTTCPRCGAPLDFAEASNAVRCKHCSVVLLVTGRRRVLSYAVMPRVGASEARALAGFTRAAKDGHMALGDPRLLFVPYYRLAAEEVFWHLKPIEAPRRPPLERLDHVGESLLGFPSLLAAQSDDRGEVELVGRRIERTFLARDADGIASWSLGVRASVLRLELFERRALEALGTVLPPAMPADAALARGLSPLPEIELVHRDVLRAVLSLVYFPLWTVETRSGAGSRATVVDAVSGSLVARDADPAALAAAAAGSGADRVLGFRPLTCPNCGWDLPLRADDVAFHCAACERTWELVGEDLEQIASEVVLPPAPRGPRVTRVAAERRLPVWEVDAAATVTGSGRVELPGRLFAPAFRWRGLKALCDLGARLSRRAPELECEPARTAALVGCSLDRRDALTLARLIALRLVTPRETRATRAGALPRVELGAARLRLLWLPFSGDAYSLREPFTGCSLARRSVEELLAEA
jgi:DNA-directed RNA polymerase subunit RPC12/RpoP